MPRRLRFCPSGLPLHIIQRGINKQACFTCNGDVAAYANWLAEGAQEHGVEVHGWVFMTNHVHLLVTPHSNEAASKLMQHIGRQYVRDFNYRYSRTGSLFEGRFRSSVVQDQRYFLNCLLYIELNPVRAGLIRHPSEYHWSSYRCHAHGQRSSFWQPHPVYQSLAETPCARQATYRKLIETGISVETVSNIRHCANKGLVLGSEAFRNQVEQMRS